MSRSYIALAFVFPLAAAGCSATATQHVAPSKGVPMDSLPGVNGTYKAPEKTSLDDIENCRKRDIARFDIGHGRSIGFRGGFKNPTLTFRMKLQPELSGDPQTDCPVLMPREDGKLTLPSLNPFK